MSKDPPLLGTETPGRYREFAQTCDHLAGQVESQTHRASLIEMADQWRRLAQEADNRGF